MEGGGGGEGIGINEYKKKNPGVQNLPKEKIERKKKRRWGAKSRVIQILTLFDEGRFRTKNMNRLPALRVEE